MLSEVEEGGRRGRERFEDATLEALNTEEGATRQGMQAASRSCKGKGVASPLEPPEEMQP